MQDAVISGGGVLVVAQGPGVRQAARGHDLSGEHIGDGSRVLAGQPHEHHRAELPSVVPQLQESGGVEQQHGPGEVPDDLIHQGFLLVGEEDRAGLRQHVAALAGHPGQDHDRRATGFGKGRHLGVGQGHLRIKAALGFHKVLHAEILMGQAPFPVFPGQILIYMDPGSCCHALQKGDGIDVVDISGAGAAFDGVDLSHAEQCDFRGGFRRSGQGQNAPGVLQQDHALGSQAAAERCVFYHARGWFHGSSLRFVF